MSDNNPRPSGWLGPWCLLVGVILLVTGLFLPSAVLNWFPWGSWYFLIAGVITLLSAIQFFRRKSSAVGLFALVFLGTLIWAFFDAGLDFWPLVSRLMVPAGLMVLAAATWPALRKREGKPSCAKGAVGVCAVLIIAMGVTFVQMFQPHPTVPFSGEKRPLVPVKDDAKQQNWDHYGNTAGGSRFVALDQITRDNVKNLKPVWTYHTGDVPESPDGNGAEDQQTPLQVGDRVFLCTPHNNVIAVDADSGKEIWKAEINARSAIWMRCRGLAYFDATKPLAQPTVAGSTPVLPAQVAPGAACQRRILMNTIDGKLIALDADNGKFCPDFGTNGSVNLHEGMGDASDPTYVLTSAPTLAGTTVVVGGRVADNVSTDMPGGVIRGYDVITGQLRWAFDPRNPDPNYVLKPGEHYKRSSANSWAPMSRDASMNTVFIPMGSSSVDLWGADRIPEDHKYATSILALDATTGKEKWVYQTVHNDLWDFDIPMQPSLVDFPTKEGNKPAVVVGTKAGQIYVLDRLTGKPLTEVKEVPVKPADIPREQYPATQPRSVGMPQIGAETLKESDMWGRRRLTSWPAVSASNQCVMTVCTRCREPIFP